MIAKHIVYSIFFILFLLVIASAWTYTTPPTSILDSSGFRFGNTSINSTEISADNLNVTNVVRDLNMGNYNITGLVSNESYSYLIWTDGTNYYVKNGSTGKVDYSGTNGNIVFTSLFSVLKSGDSIQISPGSYNTTGTHIVLTVPQVTIRGSKFGTTIFNNVETAFEIQSNNNIISDIRFNSVSGTNGNISLLLTNAHRNSFYNVAIMGGYYGLWLKGSLMNDFYSLSGSTNVPSNEAPSYAWIFASYYSGIGANANRFYNLILEGGTNGGIFEGSGTDASPSEGGFSIYGGTVEGLSGTAINVSKSYVPSIIDGVHFEANGLDIYIKSGWHFNIENSLMNRVQIVSGTGISFKNTAVLTYFQNTGGTDVFFDDASVSTVFVPMTGNINNKMSQFSECSGCDYTTGDGKRLWNLTYYTGIGAVMGEPAPNGLYYVLVWFNSPTSNPDDNVIIYRVPLKDITSLNVSTVSANNGDNTTRNHNISYSYDNITYIPLYNVSFYGEHKTASGQITIPSLLGVSNLTYKYIYIKLRQMENFVPYVGFERISIIPTIHALVSEYRPTVESSDYGVMSSPPLYVVPGDSYFNSTTNRKLLRVASSWTWFLNPENTLAGTGITVSNPNNGSVIISAVLSQCPVSSPVNGSMCLNYTTGAQNNYFDSSWRYTNGTIIS